MKTGLAHCLTFPRTVPAMERLRDRVCVVTGAGQGIGQGIARRFAAEGARVVVAELNEATGEATAASLEAGRGRFVRTDVGERASVEAMLEETLSVWGRVDVLVNNAQRLTDYARLEHKTDEDFQHCLRT